MLLVHAFATVSIADAEDDLPTAFSGAADNGDTVKVLKEAHGDDGATVNSNGDPAMPFASVELPAMKTFVPTTHSAYLSNVKRFVNKGGGGGGEYNPLVVVMYDRM